VTLTATPDASTAGRGEQPTHWVAEAACREVDAGVSLYGVLCGVAFTDVTPSRQWRDVARLRAVVASLDKPAAAGSGQAVRVRIRPPVPTFRAELGHSA